MESLVATSWEGFGELLATIQTGLPVGHTRWDGMVAVLASYQKWKNGNRDQAAQAADEIDGPLGEGLRAWYTHLRARADVPVVTPRTSPSGRGPG
ncbi:hypothetical protein AB0D67_30725 [Streptosporangium sp. NPDC048047]|uniref:hypothetical protein n=1 Tax=Streptosporangium sp. NPDC048047 TaxID=3155748 RepID=UPI003424092F